MLLFLNYHPEKKVQAFSAMGLEGEHCFTLKEMGKHILATAFLGTRVSWKLVSQFWDLRQDSLCLRKCAMSYILWRGTHGCCQPASQPALLPELAAQLFLSLLPCSYWAIWVKLPKFSSALAAWPNSPWHDMAFQRKQEYGMSRLHFPADTCPVELAGS